MASSRGKPIIFTLILRRALHFLVRVSLATSHDVPAFAPAKIRAAQGSCPPKGNPYHLRPLQPPPPSFSDIFRPFTRFKAQAPQTRALARPNPCATSLLQLDSTSRLPLPPSFAPLPRPTPARAFAALAEAPRLPATRGLGMSYSGVLCLLGVRKVAEELRREAAELPQAGNWLRVGQGAGGGRRGAGVD